MSPFWRGSSQKEAAATLLSQAKAEALELFEPWWLEQRPTVEACAQQAIAEQGERGMSLEHRIKTVHDCARILALEAHLDAAIEQAVVSKFSEGSEQFSRLFEDSRERDASVRSKWCLIVTSHGISTESLAHHFGR